MKTAFSYHRYSTDLQRNSYTLESQRRITKEIAEKHNARIIQIYEDEAISGATIDKRPSMLQLLEDLPQLKPDFLISSDQDRIARGNDFWVIKNKLVKSKTSIITEKEGLIDQNDITKDALSDMMAVFAKLERKLIGRRISRGLKSKSQKGLWHTGVAPLGYRIEKSQLVKIPEEAVLVRKIFNMSADGNGCATIAKILNAKGYKSKTDIKFTNTPIQRILTNLTYLGKVKNNGDLYDGIHEPLIDKELFKQANKTIDTMKMKSHTRRRKYLLSGFLHCGRCGNKFYGTKYYYARRKAGIVKEYLHGYACYAPFTDYCALRIIGGIDDHIIDLMNKKLKKLKLIFEKGLEIVKKTDSSLEHLKKDLKEIDSKISRLITGYVDGIIPIEEYKKRNDILKNAKISIQKELDDQTDLSITNEIYYYIKNNKLPNLNKLDFYGKRELLDMCLHKIIVNPSTSNKKGSFKNRIEIVWKV